MASMVVGNSSDMPKSLAALILGLRRKALAAMEGASQRRRFSRNDRFSFGSHHRWHAWQ
ncbi:MAG: hypothetical protein HC845_11150 [Akkermansiaceae bacterium]|nr:hypothetical protein [Akkermansiaceae bacterium]NJR41822.1 hypothetical protein [Akkermansiaceae bacterium]